MSSSTPAGSGFAKVEPDDSSVTRVRGAGVSRRQAKTAMETSAPRRIRSGKYAQAVSATGLMLSDCVALCCAALSSSIVIRMAGHWVTLAPGAVADIVSHVYPAGEALVTMVVLIAFARNGHYWRRMPFWSSLRDIFGFSLLALLCSSFVEYSSRRNDSRIFLVLVWFTFPLMVVASRALTRTLLDRIGYWKLPVLIVGGGEAARQAGLALRSEPGLGYWVAGMVNADTLLASRHLNDAAYWRRLMERRNADMLVLALDTEEAGARVLTEALVRARVPFSAMPRLEGLPVLGFGQTCFFSHDTVMFSYRNNLAKPGARVAKIAFDLSAALILLLVMLPVLVIIGLAVKLDGGPILFAHRRIGANGREFPCFKFRSMVVDADTVLGRSLASDAVAAAEWAESRKLRRDPRVTAIGRLLRATSLDELPQLLNVLRLEMSLVGPRPIVRSEISRYAENIAYYYETRPGLTGLWQVSGRSDTSYSQRVQLDTWYVKNWTIWHDVAILAKTIPAVLKRQGAV